MKINPIELPTVALWLTGNTTGISSKYMAEVAITGQCVKSRWGDTTPHDAPDLGRCVNLLDIAPSVRDCFPVLREASPVWAAYIDHWDELDALWRQGDYHVTTIRMYELRKKTTP
jgi:hypothetical protein